MKDPIIDYSMSPVELDLTNGLKQYRVPMEGEGIYHMDGDRTLFVRFNSPTAPPVFLKPGNQFKVPFNSVYIDADPSIERQTILIFKPAALGISVQEFRLGGVVDVNAADGDISTILEKRAFFKGVYQVAGASTYAQFTFENPADSEVDMYFNRAVIRSTGVIASFHVGYVDAIHGTYDASGIYALDRSASKVKTYCEASASPLTLTAPYGTIFVPENGQVEMEFKPYMYLKPGEIIGAYSANVDADIFIYLYGFERTPMQ